MQQNLNVPRRLIHEYAHSKRSKELLCFAIWLKLQHENSVVFHINDKTVRYGCHVGKAKAIRLLQDASDAPALFSVDGETIKVMSFRDKTIKTSKSRKWKYRSDKCFKIPHRKDYTLSDIYKLLNEFLVTEPIVAHEWKDCFDRENAGAPCPLSLETIAGKIQMSISSARRVIKRLCDNNIVRWYPCVKEWCLTPIEGEEERFLMSYGRKRFTYFYSIWGVLVVKPCSYSVISREWAERFEHVIYGCRSRKEENHESTIPQLCGF